MGLGFVALNRLHHLPKTGRAGRRRRVRRKCPLDTDPREAVVAAVDVVDVDWHRDDVAVVAVEVVVAAFAASCESRPLRRPRGRLPPHPAVL